MSLRQAAAEDVGAGMSVSLARLRQRRRRGSLRRQHVDRGRRTRLDAGNLQERLVSGSHGPVSKARDGEFSCLPQSRRRVSTIRRSLPALEWAAGRGRATLSISITMAFPISTLPMAWSPAHRARISTAFFWRQVVACSPDEARASHDYEQGWNAINELIRSDGTWSGYERNVFYANNRDGTFSDVSAAVGLDFVEDGRAFALADFDHDGRLEVFLKNRNAPQLRLLKNVMRGSCRRRLRFACKARRAIATPSARRSRLKPAAGRQTRMLQAGSGFLSQHSKDVFFGLGETKGPVRASIRWPSGLVQELHNLPINHRIWVEEGSEPSRMEPFKTQRDEAQLLSSTMSPREGELLPTTVETWLLAPSPLPTFLSPICRDKFGRSPRSRGKPALLNFWTSEVAGLRRKS